MPEHLTKATRGGIIYSDSESEGTVAGVTQQQKVTRAQDENEKEPGVRGGLENSLQTTAILVTVGRKSIGELQEKASVM